jgi:hypothetical protein
MGRMIQQALSRLHSYCQKEEHKGWDLFDGLNSWIFKLSPFYKSQILRLAWIQFFKRSPINFRRITLVPKGYNPKGIGSFRFWYGFIWEIRIEKKLQ